MNRIILIGNGFDLAHGLKTSYADFIDWYWKEWGKRLLHGQSKKEEDRLCSFEIKDGIELNRWNYVWNGYYYKREKPWIPWDEREVVELAKQDNNLCRFIIKDDFFREICDSIETKGWVDIENLYYAYLSQKTINFINPKDVNDDLDLIREKLTEYLLGVIDGISEDIIKNNLKSKMREPFNESDISFEGLNQGDVKMQFVEAKRKK